MIAVPESFYLQHFQYSREVIDAVVNLVAAYFGVTGWDETFERECGAALTLLTPGAALEPLPPELCVTANAKVALADDLADQSPHNRRTVDAVVNRLVAVAYPNRPDENLLRNANQLVPALHRPAEVALLLLPSETQPEHVNDIADARVNRWREIPSIVDAQIDLSNTAHDRSVVEAVFVRAADALIDFLPFEIALTLVAAFALPAPGEPGAPTSVADVTEERIGACVYLTELAITRLVERQVATDGRVSRAGGRFIQIFPLILAGLPRHEREWGSFLFRGAPPYGISYYVNNLIVHYLGAHGG